MKRKLIICSSLITLILACFSVPIFAEEDPSDTPSIVPIPNSIRLDSYFFDNYDLLPYIESDGNQYIDSGILGSSSLKIETIISDFQYVDSSSKYFYGTNTLKGGYIFGDNNRFRFVYNGTNFYLSENLNYPYLRFNVVQDRNNLYINGSLVKTFDESSFTDSVNIYIFQANGDSRNKASLRMYSFKIYDYSSNEYVRYYYPAKSKSGGVIGLYDAVSDTFVTTGGSDPFESPINDQVLNFQIGSFITSSLGWIGQIFTAIIQMPIIIIFMAIGLAGAMFRWGRRIVHF